MLVFDSLYLYYYCLVFENFIHLSMKYWLQIPRFFSFLSIFHNTSLSYLPLFSLLFDSQVQSALPICAWVWDHPLNHRKTISGHTFNEKMSFVFPPVINCQLFLIKGEAWRLPHISMEKFLAGLIFYRSCGGAADVLYEC